MYLYIGMLFTMMWPMARGIFVDDLGMWRREGETGLQFIFKMVGVWLVWPIPFLAIGVYILKEFVIPWLTTPA